MQHVVEPTPSLGCDMVRRHVILADSYNLSDTLVGTTSQRLEVEVPNVFVGRGNPRPETLVPVDSPEHSGEIRIRRRGTILHPTHIH